MKSPRLIITKDVVGTAAREIAGMVHAAIADRGQALLALCGGSTPAPVYTRLAQMDLDWSRVQLFFGDERCVPPGHADSTYRLVRESLLDRIEGAGPVVHRMQGEEPDREAEASRYAALLPQRLDLAIQGMGPDGHTASLFPGHSALGEEHARVLHIVGPKPPPLRLTVTPPVLRAARETLVMLRGADKAHMLQRVFTEAVDPTALPVQLVLGGLWIMDEDAATGLPKNLLTAEARRTSDE